MARFRQRDFEMVVIGAITRELDPHARWADDAVATDAFVSENLATTGP
jgi:hypothetical protein